MVQFDASTFTVEWIAAWNSHDLDRIISHYSAEIAFLSPIAQQRMGNGRVVGVEALLEYWGRGLKASPDLRFELIDVLRGHECLIPAHLRFDRKNPRV